VRRCGCHSHNGLLLSPEGLAPRELESPGVDAMAPELYLDLDGSVSGLRRDETRWDYELLDQQYRRFLHGV